MALSLRNVPIKRKLMLVILLTSGFAILLMGSALITYEIGTFRRTLTNNIEVLAQIIGSNSTAALAFDDRENANEILRGLAAENQITVAAIYDRTGRLFAKFPESVTSEQLPPEPGPDGHRFNQLQLVTVQPIFQEGARLGTIYLQADLSQMYRRLTVYGILLLVVSICSFLGAMALSAALQRRISVPILELAKVATAVSHRKDYSVRAAKHGTDEIGHLTESFNQMLARIGESNAALTASEERLRVALEAAEAANREKDQFLAIVSHELRTPLTPALAAAAMLESDETISPQVRHDLSVIRRNIEMEARLIDDLLDINRIVRGKLELRRQVVDVRSLLEHAMQNYCLDSAAKKQIRVSMKVTAADTHVFVDSSRITQVFWNLLQNACKFTSNGGSIEVRVYNEYRQLRSTDVVSTNGESDQLSELVVEVSDTGMGISPETLPKIFNAFEQGQRSRGQGFGGLGLGLAISRAIVELHGGSIAAASEGPGKGATFTVRLYCVKPVLSAETDRQINIASEAFATRSMRVLVVEDHQDTAEQFARLLKRAGHEVICAGSIKEAQTYALMTPDQNRACAFDILISDLDLPDGSGRELMRNLAERYAIHGIAISGHGLKEDVDASEAAGFAYHITKPVNWTELKSVIDKISDKISQKAAPSPSGLVPSD
jgi:signal transduction histidine kinase/ActR/RegA family two-component response regulator